MTIRAVLVETGRRRRRDRGLYHRRHMDAAPGHGLIGRTRELERLSSALRRAVDGGSSTVLVVGEAGIGKTALVEAFVAEVERTGGRVLTGWCLPLETGGLPYAPFVAMFRALLEDVDPGAVPALLGPDRVELARLIPEVRGRRSDPSTPDARTVGDGDGDGAVDDRYAQVRLFELALGVVRRLARIKPLVLVIEDLQWADPSTRDLLTYLVRNLHHEPVLVVATARDDEPGGPGDGVDLAELDRHPRVERIDLPRLDRDALRELLEHALGGAPDAGFVERTLARTGGNPFFAEQVVAARRETGSDDLPARLRDVILARLASVSPSGQSVLRAASAAGRRIDDRLLGAVLDQPPEAVESALREVIDRHLLVRAGGSSDPHVVFRHALLQELIHQDLLPGERARLHERYARALEPGSPERHVGGRAGPVASAAELAYHWDEAGDRPRALAATLEAAQDAERGYAWAEANQRYERALVLIAALPRERSRGGRGMGPRASRRDGDPVRRVRGCHRPRPHRDRDRRSGRRPDSHRRAVRATALVPLARRSSGGRGRCPGRGGAADPE